MINNVSFGSTVYNTAVNAQSFKGSNPYGSYDAQPDSFETSEAKKAPAKKAQPQHAKTPQKTKKTANLTLMQKIGLILSGVAIGGGAFAGGNAIQNHEPTPEVGIYGEIIDEDTLQYVAELYGSDPETILGYNGCETVEELAEKEVVEVPKAFDPYGEQIEELQKKLYDENLTVKEQSEIASEIENLKAKREALGEVATVYQVGKYVYFDMKKTVSAENLKELVGIEDGALRKNNNLEPNGYVEIEHPGEKSEYYQDYSGVALSEGETYKVGVKDFVK